MLFVMSQQLTLIQDGEFVVCEEVRYLPSPEAESAAGGRGIGAASVSLHARSRQPINTTKAICVRLGNDILPAPFLRSRERRAVSDKIRIDGPLATRIAAELGLLAPRAAA